MYAAFSVLAAYAFNCFDLLYQSYKNNNIFSTEKEKRKDGRRKKDMQVEESCSGGCQGFLEKNTTRSVAEVWRFFQKPAGLDLYSR
jgi:hypothetical protein